MDFTPNHEIIKWTTADPASMVAESAAQADSVEAALDSFGGSINTVAALDAISTAAVGSQYFVTSPGTGISPLSFRAVSGVGSSVSWVANETVVANTKTNLDNFISTVAATTDIRFKPGGSAFSTATKQTYTFTSATGSISPNRVYISLKSGSGGTATATASVVPLADPAPLVAGNISSSPTNATINILEAGSYRVEGYGTFGASTAGSKTLGILKNGATQEAAVQYQNQTFTMSVGTIIACAVGDTLALQSFANVATTLGFGANYYNVGFSAEKMGV